MTNSLSEADHSELVRVAENMWRAETRFDFAFMRTTLAKNFFEYGRSGRTYTREEILTSPREAIEAEIPLPNFTVRLLDENTTQATNDSAATCNGAVEYTHRCSIWSRTALGWVMRFHQGTPFVPEVVFRMKIATGRAG